MEMNDLVGAGAVQNACHGSQAFECIETILYQNVALTFENPKGLNMFSTIELSRGG
jgi:hypothetical protein